MKNLTEILNGSINEAREEIYSVAFGGFNDKEGMAISVKVTVPKEYAKDFEKWLEKQGGDTVMHADGLTNDFELLEY